MKRTREAIRSFVKSRTAAALGAALLVGCSGATPPELPRDEAQPSSGPSEESNQTRGDDATGSRVVGYLPLGRLGTAPLHFETLTHLILAFALPTNNKAELRQADPEAITKVVTAAHGAGVKVLVALAGGADEVETKAALRNGFGDYVTSVIDLVTTYELDGVDVDIEGDAIEPDTYEALMLALAKELRDDAKPKLLTAAVGLWRSENYRALGAIDFLNVMSYDHCPSWQHECEHATLGQAKDDLAYWAGLEQADEHGKPRTIGAANVVLGVPFYGRCYGKVCPWRPPGPGGSLELTSTLTYRQIMEYCDEGTFSNCASTDVITDGNGADGYYVSLNGPLTIRRKTNLAKEYGGLMIWELGQDSSSGELFAEVQAAFPKGP